MLLLVVALAANVGAIVWKGGEITGRFDSLIERVGMMNGQMQAVSSEQSAAGRDLSVAKTRLDNHETRINKIEDRRL